MSQVYVYGDEWWNPARYPAKDAWGECPPGHSWYWNPVTMTWEIRKNVVLTTATNTTKVLDMGHREVIEYTDHHPDEDSTSISDVWYNANTQRMTVRFKHGGGSGLYSYDDVAEDLFVDFINAESLGGFFHSVFSPKDGDKWPGTKHDARTTFEKVEREVADVVADLDALKPEALTLGVGQEFKLRFTYSGKGEMAVRAPDYTEAVDIFRRYMSEHGFTVEVTEVAFKL